MVEISLHISDLNTHHPLILLLDRRGSFALQRNGSPVGRHGPWFDFVNQISPWKGAFFRSDSFDVVAADV